VFYALGMVLSMAFNGAGDTWTPTWINVACFWLWEIPLAYVLARVVLHAPLGAFLAIMIGYSTFAVVAVALFRRGRWKVRAV
jgi:Na+-driven multidrug efflux pump